MSVFNGSERSGLASATVAQLEERGFVAGDVGDAPQQISSTQIWADDATNPAIQLVQRQFKRAKVVSGTQIGPGVVVVVGEKFTTLRTSRSSPWSSRPTPTFCKATGSE